MRSLLLVVVFFGFNLVGSGEGKVEKAEMAQLWIDYVVAVYKEN